MRPHPFFRAPNEPTSNCVRLLQPRCNMANTQRSPLCHDGRVSLLCFAATLTIVLSLSMSEYIFDFVPDVWSALLWGPLLYYFMINISLRMYYREHDYQIAVRATFLGFVLAISVLLAISGPPALRPFGVYAAAMATFHYTEYLSIAWTNPAELRLDSFMLNHSVPYAVAAVSSWIEYGLEAYWWPEMKQLRVPLAIGLTLTVGGEVLRKLAILTASANFNHVVQFQKATDHRLVRNGVYGWFRHPSYVGWFWWSIGTQLVLSNPVCCVVYAVVSWKFFKDRIYVEEITLLNFFGREYLDYQRCVGTGLPGIRGYEVKEH